VNASSSARTGIVTWGPVALALGMIAAATLVPMSPGMPGDAIPFWCLGCGDYALADAVANVVLFVPLGWALARTGVRSSSGLAVVLTTTIGVESLQYAVIAGRVASVADILANTLGGLIGLLLPYLHRWVVDTGRRAVCAAIVYGSLLIACLGAGGATQAILSPRTLYWTRGKADGSRYVPFTGALREVLVDGAPITLEQWRDVPPGKGGDIEVALTSGRPDTGLAHVVIAWMPNGRGWLWLEQRNRDLHIHLASGSDHARLQGHSLWLRRVMPAVAGDPVTVRLVVRRFGYRIVLVSTAGDVVREARITPGDGWRLFAPGEREWSPWAGVLTAGWMAVLLAPLGYLASVRSGRAVAVVAVGASISLVLLSLGSGGTWLGLPGWCGAVIGFLVGLQRSAVLRRTRCGVSGRELSLP